MKIGVPLGRLDEMLTGVNFGAELAYHVEVVLKLPSGFMDKPGAMLSESELSTLRDLPQEDPLEDDPPLKLRTAGAPAANPEPVPSPLALEPEKSLASLAAAVPSTAVSMNQPPKEPLVSTKPATPATAEELEIATRVIRRANFEMLTKPKGVKSRLVALTGLSAANISHRLHGHKLFDAETGEFFCQKIGLPSGWFEQPRTEADIPPEAKALLSGAIPLPAVAPALQPKTVSKTILTKPAATPLAPTKAQTAVSAETLSLSSAAIGAAVGKKPRMAKVSARAAAPSATTVAPVATPAPGPVESPVSTPLSAHPAAVAMSPAAPMVQAYLLVLNQKIRDGRVSDEKALELLQAALAL